MGNFDRCRSPNEALNIGTEILSSAKDVMTDTVAHWYSSGENTDDLVTSWRWPNFVMRSIIACNEQS